MVSYLLPPFLQLDVHVTELEAGDDVITSTPIPAFITLSPFSGKPNNLLATVLTIQSFSDWSKVVQFLIGSWDGRGWKLDADTWEEEAFELHPETGVWVLKVSLLLLSVITRVPLCCWKPFPWSWISVCGVLSQRDFSSTCGALNPLYEVCFIDVGTRVSGIFPAFKSQPLLRIMSLISASLWSWLSLGYVLTLPIWQICRLKQDSSRLREKHHVSDTVQNKEKEGRKMKERKSDGKRGGKNKGKKERKQEGTLVTLIWLNNYQIMIISYYTISTCLYITLLVEGILSESSSTQKPQVSPTSCTKARYPLYCVSLLFVLTNLKEKNDYIHCTCKKPRLLKASLGSFPHNKDIWFVLTINTFQIQFTRGVGHKNSVGANLSSQFKFLWISYNLACGLWL